MKYKTPSCPDKSRLSRVGGQAVLEGVMMKAGDHTVTSCRKEDGSIVVSDNTFVSVRKKHKFLNIPLLRGIVNFIEMMSLSVKTLEASTAALGLEEEEETKFEKWLKKHFGMNITKFIMAIGVVLGLALSVGLFIVLPSLVGMGVEWLVNLAGGTLGLWISVVEGIAKVAIFVLYLWLVTFMPEIKRTFMYHGAEHKTIATFEAGVELTPENCKEYTRYHPRCGTSFMFFMILLGIIAGLVIRIIWPQIQDFPVYYILIRLAILPLVVGIGYEFIMFAGKHDNFIVRMLSAPGLWVQRITTKEPTLEMLEVAIVSTKCALRDEYPEFMEFYQTRAWEKHPEPVVTEDAPTVTETTEDNGQATEEAVVIESVITEECPVCENITAEPSLTETTVTGTPAQEEPQTEQTVTEPQAEEITPAAEEDE